MIKTRGLKPIPDYGAHMTMEEWINDVRAGGLIDYDGTGYYATRHGISDIKVVPSDVAKGLVDRSWSHVMWFNK